MLNYSKDEVKKMSDEELDKAMEKKYGADWGDDIISPPKEPLAEEFLSRLFMAS